MSPGPDTAPDGIPRVLHICSDFARQRLYGDLVSALEAAGVRQIVYVPVRTAAELDANRDPSLASVTWHYSHVLRPRHRLLFRAKIRTVTRDVRLHLTLSGVTVTHAHFLFSDGAVALRLRRALGIPYVVAVRNTDVNAFMRLRPDLRWIGQEILRQASRIVFPTPAYLEVVERWLPPDLRPMVSKKASIVPNGLSQFWIERSEAVPRGPDGRLRLLYVGDFTRNKNVAGVVRATRVLSRSRPVALTLVGGGGDGEADVDALLASGEFPSVQRTGRVAKREDLLAIYRSHDVFVMPSFRETFGIAYLEALSQGLPIVHARGQGVDGYFSPGGVSEAVDPRDDTDIARGVHAVARRLPDIRAECASGARSFAWPAIADRYLHIYRDAAAGREAGLP